MDSNFSSVPQKSPSQDSVASGVGIGLDSEEEEASSEQGERCLEMVRGVSKLVEEELEAVEGVLCGRWKVTATVVVGEAGGERVDDDEEIIDTSESNVMPFAV